MENVKIELSQQRYDRDRNHGCDTKEHRINRTYFRIFGKEDIIHYHVCQQREQI